MRMTFRRKNISFFYTTLCVAIAGLLLVSGRVSSQEIYQLQDEAAHRHDDPSDHDEKPTHVHTHRHKDGTTHSHTHYHGHCGGKVSCDPMHCFYLNSCMMPGAVLLVHSAILMACHPIRESHISGIFRPPILA
jgi:ABC-type Zn2+ transport system substrate-binding protein/surface adhesin